MPKRLPITAAKQLANRYGLRQVILSAWDGTTTHVVTYGKTLADSAMAATGGNRWKKSMKWPKDTMAESARIARLQAQAKRASRILAFIETQASSAQHECDAERVLGESEERVSHHAAKAVTLRLLASKAREVK